ncbi:hypothetical protein [Elioraea thermophila]|uniref:hypothetical protein n=1 Tax=Elioraea thermophila TaxID=2185104 RepID=UPI000DF144EF|nr:hypothetical protein [Elioraea thermophila]
MAARDCIAAIRAAGRGLIDDADVEELVERVQKHIDRVRAEGRAARADAEIRTRVAKDAEALRLEQALARKHAALTVLARQRVLDQIAVFRAAGLDPRKAVLAVLEGTARGVPGARASVAQVVGAYRADYLGGLFAKLDALGPRVIAALRDGAGFQDAVVREMRALGRGGQVQGPPVTGNELAQKVAVVFAEAADRARQDLNRLGGMVGELEGWSPQAHDRARIARAGREAWIDFLLPRLDLERSFPDAAGDERAVRGILAEMFDSITANVDRLAPERDQATAASRVTPTPNLARSLARSRVLHFKDATAWLQYREQFASGHVFDAMIKHLERAARMAGQMEVLGPNPTYTLQTALDRLRLDIRNDPAIPAEKKAALARALTLDRGDIRSAYAEMQGLTFGVGGSQTVAEIASELRAWQGVVKLAGAFLSSAFTDPWISIANSRFLGRTWGEAIAGHVRDFLGSATDRDAKRLAYKLGAGFDTLAQRITTSYFVHDGQPGVMQRLLNWTMRYQGLSWFTDHLRSVHSRLLAEDLAEAAAEFRRGGWNGVHERMRHALTLHGIGPREWAVISKAAVPVEAGRRVLTPDAVAALPDAAIAPAIAEKLARAEKAAAQRARRLVLEQAGVTRQTATAEQIAEAERAGREAAAATRARLIGEERRRLQLLVLGMVYDEGRAFSVIEPNAQIRRLMLQGTERGTWAGEIMRFLAAFKSWPVGFTVGPLARQWHGGPSQRSAGIGNIAMLIAGLAVGGYAAMTAKDFVRGYGPRDPTRRETILAAMLQSGGLGIYGDFLFAETSRFGAGALGTLAGPVVSEAGALIDLFQRARDGEAKAAEALNWALRNTPFINLWYVRPALDWLILNELREAASPGFLARQQRQRYRDYGQAPLPWLGEKLDVF